MKDSEKKDNILLAACKLEISYQSLRILLQSVTVTSKHHLGNLYLILGHWSDRIFSMESILLLFVKCAHAQLWLHSHLAIYECQMAYANTYT